MRRWLDAEGIRPTDLRAVRIDERHVIFMATFEEAIEAALFVRQFGELNTARLKMAAKAVSN